MIRLFSSVTILLSLLVFLTVSCKEEYGAKRIRVNIKTDDPIEVSTEYIGTNGGSIKISKPETPVDGLEITVPENSFSSGQTIKIFYSKIIAHRFGDNFVPISPMITIACDGGYANGPMTVTIPVPIPDGHVPIGFYLDESTGKLEGIPVQSVTANSITLITRHFLSGNQLRSTGVSLKSSKVETNTGAKIIVSSISESILNSMPIISSGFKPGIDDWEFVNNGSYLAPRGHCAGQDMAAMWYYFEKKETEGGLFNKYSAVPAIEADNAIGYRLCSVVHKDIDPNNTGAVNSLFWENIDRNQDLDQLKIFSIAGAMLVTGEPQGISIYRQSGTNADGYPLYNGHDLICYQMGMIDGVMYISDPNTPGNGQKIDFKDGRFEPYSAKLNGNATSEEYKYISWYAKTAWIDWNQLGIRFKELTDSTIGNQAPNNFPAYTIWVKGQTDTRMTNGFTSSSDTLRCYVECPTAELAYPENGKRLTRFSMHDENGYKIDVAEYGRKYYVLLKPGLNKIGFFITARKEGVLDLAGNICDLYVDFKWFNVYFSKLKISPNPIKGDPDTEIKITAMSDGTAPKSANYVWTFGDGTKEVTVKNDSIVKHKFPKDGSFTVIVKLYDSSTNKLVGSAAARAIIGATCSDGSFEYEGRTYGYKLIGTQTWMTENLAYLPSASPASAASNVIANYHVYDYAGTTVSDAKASKNYDTYGVLYNWTAAQTACPTGWHLPSNGEWTELTNYLGGKAVAGGKIKEAGTTHWGGENTGNNESCFTALPGGFHSYDGKFYSLTGMAYFWSSTAVDKFSAWSRVLFESKVDITDWPYVKDYGCSVRCVKDF